GVPVVRDAIGGVAGPPAGLHAGLSAISTTYAVTAPCGSPFFPLGLVSRPSKELVARGAQLAVARAVDSPHPVLALTRRDVLSHLAAFLDGGGRKIDAWYATLAVIEVPFDDEADAFRNINTAEELAASTLTR